MVSRRIVDALHQDGVVVDRHAGLEQGQADARRLRRDLARMVEVRLNPHLARRGQQVDQRSGSKSFCGSVTGTRVPMRMTSTCGMAARLSRKKRSLADRQRQADRRRKR